MKIENYLPGEILKPFIKKYTVIQSWGELENRVLPSTSLAIAFRFRGSNSYSTDAGNQDLPSITFSGLRKSVRLIHYAKNTSTLVVLFKECGASVFFKEPLHELFEKSFALDTIIGPNESDTIQELLSEAQNNYQRVAIIEQFLLRNIRSLELDGLVSEAVTKIHAAKGFLKIKELTGTLHISNDAFEKRFRKIIGSSPKQFSSLVRMSAIVKKIPSERFLDMALEAGFYDQAHFNKEFKLFTGQTPTDFYRSASFW